MAKQKRKRAPRRSRDEWKQIINQSNTLDISPESFCKQNNICYTNFVKWRSVFKNERHHPEKEAPFVELKPFPSVPASEPPLEEKKDWVVELNIGEHLVLRVKAS